MMNSLLWLLLLVTCCCPQSTLGFQTAPSHRGRTETMDSLLARNPPADTADVTLQESPSSQSSSTNNEVVTSALLRISYDGSRFTGWSAANSETQQPQQQQKEESKLPRPSKRNRRRGVMGDIPNDKKGFVRSVERVLRDNLAKIYGNVDPRRIVVEGCSRTDRGVHAHGMIAQVYCLQENILKALEQEQQQQQQSDKDNDETIINCSIPGKRKPHPTSSTDASYFEPMPMSGNLSRIAFALNRMRPPDVQITGIAPTPSLEESSTCTPFHPSLSTTFKTYEYRISVGAFHDPTIRKSVWHVGNSIDVIKMQEGCGLLLGTHDFSAFQGAPRGSDDKRRRMAQPSTLRAATCTLADLQIVPVPPPVDDLYFLGVTPPLQTFKVIVTGDRFLYKMVRFLVGAFVAVGLGKLELEDLSRALERGNWDIPHDEDDRRQQFKCAPAHGLVLCHVDYGDIVMDWQPVRDYS